MRPAGEISCVLRCLSVGGDLWSFFYTLHFDIGQCVCRASFVFPSISFFFFFSFIFFLVCLGESIPACNLYCKHSSLSLVPRGFFSVELGQRTFPQARQREKKTKYHPRNLSIPVCLWHWASKQTNEKKGEKKCTAYKTTKKKKSPLQCCVYMGVSFIDLFFSRTVWSCSTLSAKSFFGFLLFLFF